MSGSILPDIGGGQLIAQFLLHAGDQLIGRRIADILFQYLYGQEEKAIPYAQRWAELDQEDENASAVIQECKAAGSL